MKNINTLYRYVRFTTADCDGDIVSRQIKLTKYPIVSITPKGYWIKVLNKQKWVSNSAKSRFAYPTEHEAYENFKFRTKKAIRILKGKLSEAQVYLNMAEDRF